MARITKFFGGEHHCCPKQPNMAGWAVDFIEVFWWDFHFGK
jgi:hypothetical protein